MKSTTIVCPGPTRSSTLISGGTTLEKAPKNIKMYPHCSKKPDTTVSIGVTTVRYSKKAMTSLQQRIVKDYDFTRVQGSLVSTVLRALKYAFDTKDNRYSMIVEERQNNQQGSTRVLKSNMLTTFDSLLGWVTRFRRDSQEKASLFSFVKAMYCNHLDDAYWGQKVSETLEDDKKDLKTFVDKCGGMKTFKNNFDKKVIVAKQEFSRLSLLMGESPHISVLSKGEKKKYIDSLRRLGRLYANSNFLDLVYPSGRKTIFNRKKDSSWKSAYDVPYKTLSKNYKKSAHDNSIKLLQQAQAFFKKSNFNSSSKSIVDIELMLLQSNFGENVTGNNGIEKKAFEIVEDKSVDNIGSKYKAALLLYKVISKRTARNLSTAVGNEQLRKLGKDIISLQQVVVPLIMCEPSTMSSKRVLLLKSFTNKANQLILASKKTQKEPGEQKKIDKVAALINSYKDKIQNREQPKVKGSKLKWFDVRS